LRWGTTNWFTSPKGNNTQPFRTRVVKSLLEEAKHHRLFRKKLLKRIPELYDLRSEILQIITGTIGLNHFKTWPEFDSPHKSVKPKSYQDEFVVQNLQTMEGSKYSAQVTKAFQTMVNNLNKLGVLGIKAAGENDDDPDAYGLHPAVQKVFHLAYWVSLA
jgi:hypothetical protein